MAGLRDLNWLMKAYPWDVQLDTTTFPGYTLLFVNRAELQRKLQGDRPYFMLASWERAMKHAGFAVAQSTHGHAIKWKVWIEKKHLQTYKTELNPNEFLLEARDLDYYVQQFNIPQEMEI